MKTKTTSKIKTAIVSFALALCVALGITAIALPKAATLAQTAGGGAIREYKEYSLQTTPSGTVNVNKGLGIDRHFFNGYIGLETTGGGTGGAHSLKISLEQADFSEFKTVWINGIAISCYWGETAASDVRALIKFFDENGTEVSWNAKKAEPTVDNNADMSVSYMYQSYGKGSNKYDEFFRDNSYIKIEKGVDNWYGLKFQSAKGTFENIMSDSTANADLSKISYVTIGFDSYEKDVAVDIGEIYGETFGGEWVRIFNPVKAEMSDSAELNKPNQVYYSKSGAFAETAVTNASVYGAKYTITNQNDWRWVSNLITGFPSDVSEYNAISFKADNTADSNRKSFEFYFSQNSITWSNSMGTGAIFIPETGDKFIGDGRYIPAGFKGEIILPLSTFRNKFGTTGQLDIKNLPTNFGAIVEQHESYVGTVYLNDFKLINNAEVEYREYRYVENALGDLKYANVSRTQYDGDAFKPEILTEGGSVNGSSTSSEWEEYNSLIAGITTEEEFNKKYTLESSERHSDSGIDWIANYGEIRTSYRVRTEYRRVKYTVTFDENTGGDVDDITLAWGAKVTLPVPVKAGYTFGGWFEESDAEFSAAVTLTEMPVENKTLKAKWTANTDTAYTVKHVYQGTDGEYPTTGETETLTGTTDTAAAVTLKNKTGFNAGTFAAADINGDGSTVIEVRYERVKTNVTFVDTNLDGTLKSDPTTREDVFFEAEVELPDEPTAPENYEFVGWFLGLVEAETVTFGDSFDGFAAAENLTVYAKYAKIQTTYKVIHRLENLDGSGFDEVTADAETKNIEAGETTAASAKTYEGFTAGDVVNVTAAGAGSTVITIDYTRNSYMLTFKSGDDALSSATVKFGASVTFPDDPTAPENHTFAGWKKDETAVDANTFTMPAGDVTITASFTENTVTDPADPDEPNGGNTGGEDSEGGDGANDDSVNSGSGCSCGGGAEFMSLIGIFAAALGLLVTKKH